MGWSGRGGVSPATVCTAVGLGTLAEHWNGTSRTIQSIRTRPGVPVASLVSCTSAMACTAVGSGTTRTVAANDVTLAEYWNGTTWGVITKTCGSPT